MLSSLCNGIALLSNAIASLLFFQDSSLDFPPPSKRNFDHSLTQDTIPLQCHSHNDYHRRTPLYEALSIGCTGVEVDIWIFEDELYVGHNANTLTRNRTLRSMYLDPLMELLDHKNLEQVSRPMGIFGLDSSQTLVLLIDFKGDGYQIFPLVQEQLALMRERGYLSYFDGSAVITGPITVVATGTAPFSLIASNSDYRDIFFDAPLAGMGEGLDSPSLYNATNSYYASANFRRAIGHLWLPWRWGKFYQRDIERIRVMVGAAKRRGLKTRFWGAPSWPRGLRDVIWERLVREGADVLNGDDLVGMGGVVTKRRRVSGREDEETV